MGVFQKLLNVQQNVKCLKSQYNSFGKYRYRSLEDIWAAVKPIAANFGAVLICTDKPVQIGDRYYIEATASIYDVETGESISTNASAREDESKKGMDGSQITGTASSYARKYAMGGLLGLDDTKDADTDSYHNEINARAQKAGQPESEQPPEEQPPEEQPDIPQKSDRKINIKTCIELSKQKGATALINEDGYRGKAWDTLTDEEIVKVKMWITSAKKKSA